MKRKAVNAVLALMAVLAMTVSAFGQAPKVPFNLDHLAKQAKESVTVTLDKSLIDLILKFLPKNDPDAARIREAVKGLEGIYVRSFEFDKEGAYSMSEVNTWRKQLIGPGWTKIVEVRGEDENVDVSLHQDGEKILGFVIISAEPKELTIVNIVGTITPEQFSQLEGFGGIPHIGGIGKKGAHNPPQVKIEVEKPKKEE